jgi:hypothetical protein
VPRALADAAGATRAGHTLADEQIASGELVIEADGVRDVRSISPRVWFQGEMVKPPTA